MITKERRVEIRGMMENMPDGQVLEFIRFNPSEVEYIMWLIKNQTGNADFYFETNGTASSPKTITKFRKVWKRRKSPFGHGPITRMSR